MGLEAHFQGGWFTRWWSAGGLSSSPPAPSWVYMSVHHESDPRESRAEGTMTFTTNLASEPYSIPSVTPCCLRGFSVGGDQAGREYEEARGAGPSRRLLTIEARGRME